MATAVAHSHAVSATVAATFRLSVVRGPDTGQSVLVDAARPSPLLIGHSTSCELRLSDRQVSRRHAAADVSGSRLHLTDLGSTNGTFVNEVAVQGAFLRGGEQVRVGETTIDVTLLEAATVTRLPSEQSYGRVIGGSAEMRRLYPLCDKLAATNIPVLIEGETGTGKELLAESLHEKGQRVSAPFIVSPALVESELFGHERGAFTGAVTTRKGVFEQAHTGTLLIDEIGDLDAALQPKLLRALERSEVRRVGGSQLIKVDVRVLAATRRNLDHEVQAGRFRDDLFHRLAVARIALPPLRERRGDVTLLARRFAKQLGVGHGTGKKEGELPESLLMRWEDYEWPGNVRELRNAVMRYLALGEADVGDDSDIDSPSPDQRPSVAGAPGMGALEAVLALRLPYSMARQRALAEFEREYITRVLAEHGGNVLRAAAASGIARRHLQRVRARNQK